MFYYDVGMEMLLKHIKIDERGGDEYPFNLPLFSKGLNLMLTSPITFIVGENGSGKSTLLESLAHAVGFNTLGGNKNHIYTAGQADDLKLAEAMHLVWSVKQTQGFFFRAETFFEFAKNIDNIAGDHRSSLYRSYGGKSLQLQSHGESFMAFFENKVKRGIYILDEPEAGLSPEKQLALISILNNLAKTGECQFIIATHSPLLIATPNSTLFEINDGKLIKKPYNQTKQFLLYKDFCNAPDHFVHYLCN